MDAPLGYYNPNLRKQGEKSRKLAAERSAEATANRDPRTYGFVSGLLGDEYGSSPISVLDPKRAKSQTAQDVGMAVGTALNVLPALQAIKAPQTVAKGALKAINDAHLYGEGFLAPFTPQVKNVLPPSPKFNKVGTFHQYDIVQPEGDFQVLHGAPKDWKSKEFKAPRRTVQNGFMGEMIGVHGTTDPELAEMFASGWHLDPDSYTPGKFKPGSNIRGYNPKGKLLDISPVSDGMDLEDLDEAIMRLAGKDPADFKYPAKPPTAKQKKEMIFAAQQKAEEMGIDGIRYKNTGDEVPRGSTEKSFVLFPHAESGFGKDFKGGYPDPAPVSKKAKQLQASPYTQEVLPAAEREKNLKNFLEPSVEKEPWYHGTGDDIHAFDLERATEKPKQAKAIFVAQKPPFAESFANDAPAFMAQNADRYLTPEQKQKALENAKQYFTDTYGKEMPEHAEAMIKSLESGNPTGEAQDELFKGYKDFLPSSSNMMKLHVQVKNPFDAAVPEHVEKLRSVNPDLPLDKLHQIETLETPEVQKAIQDANFDAFYTNEGGSRNLGIYDPAKLKSVHGNRGTYDTDYPELTKKDGGSVSRYRRPVKLSRYSKQHRASQR